MRYTENVSIPASEVDRVNRLLSIESLSELTNTQLLEKGANTDQCEGIFHVAFSDGSSLNFDLCSGCENYFDDVVWTSPDGSRDVVLDCAFELDDIEFDVDDNTYEVKIVIT